MKLVKLNKFGDFVTKEKAEEIYLNADKIISVRQTSEYSEIDVAYQDSWCRWKVQETVEEIQYQLDGKPREAEVDKKLVGRQIRKIRREKGMTLEEFGKMLGVCKSVVCSWDVGKSLPRHDNLEKIADFAGMTVQELLEGWKHD